MGHVVRDAHWSTIDIDTSTGQIFLQERWQYNWLTEDGVTPWTLAQKRAFHTRADRAIWAAWSNRATMTASGTSDFARRMRGRALPINLDVRWVTSNPHWTVNVTKIPAGTFRQSNVDWPNRVINFDTEDFTTRTFNDGGTRSTQVPVTHEFGHTIGNVFELERGDEYHAGGTNVNDHGSMMNHGQTLRSRHFQTILDEMNQMIPNTTFAVGTIR